MAPVIDSLEDNARRSEAQNVAPRASNARASSAVGTGVYRSGVEQRREGGGVFVKGARQTAPAPRNPAIDDFYSEQQESVVVSQHEAPKLMRVDPATGKTTTIGQAQADYRGGVEGGGITRIRGTGGKVVTHMAPDVQARYMDKKEAEIKRRQARGKKEEMDLAAAQGERRSEQAAAKRERRGLTPREVLTLQRSKQEAQRRLGAGRTRDTRAALPAGTQVAGLPGTEQEQATQDWNVVYGGMRNRTQDAQSLSEYDAAFKKIQASLPGSGIIQDEVRKDYMADMPPQVRAEYQQGQLDIQNAKEAARSAQKLRIETLAKETFKMAGGMTVNQILAKQVGRETRAREKAKIEETEAGDVAHGVARTRRAAEKAGDVAESKARGIERFESDPDVIAAKSERKKEEILAKGEAEEAVAAGRHPAKLAREKEMVEARTMVAGKTKRQLKDIYGPDTAEKLVNLRKVYSSAQSAYDKAEKAYRAELEPTERVGGKLYERRVDAQKVAKFKALRDEASQKRDYYESQITDLAEVGSPSAEKKALAAPRGPEDISYEKLYDELAKDGTLSKRDIKKLDNAWVKTGRPDEASRHSVVKYSAPPEYTGAAGDTEQRAGIASTRRYEEGPNGMIIPAGLTKDRLFEDLRTSRVTRAKAMRVVTEMGW